MRKLAALLSLVVALCSVSVALASSGPVYRGAVVRPGTLLTAPKEKRHVKSYRWQRCNRSAKKCGNIARATHRTYKVQRADIGHRIRVRIAFASDPVTAVSNATGVVTALPPPAPVNTSLPTISGGTVQGDTLTASLGTWTGASSFSYQWEDCDSSGANCVAISGASGTTTNSAFAPTYVLQASDVGSTVRIAVTASA